VGDDSTARPRALVIEDEFIIAVHLEAALSGAGREVVGPVGDLAAGLDLAARERLDAALLGLKIQGEDVSPVAEALAARACPS
jgi:DNA-binding response OmpR family regulator